MRLAKILLPLVLLNAVSVHAQDNPALVARLIGAGAPQLALKQARLYVGQPDSDPAWRDVLWEAAGHAGKRLGVEIPPPSAEAPSAAWRAYWLTAAQAAIEQGHGPEARGHVARVLWQDAVRPEERREARRLAAESWLLPGQDGDDVVNPVWLRLVQDYPQERRHVEAVALRLLQSGQLQRALRLLEGVGLEEGPAFILAGYRLGHMGQEQAEAQLRAAASGKDGAVAWKALASLAEDRSDRALRVEALERLLAASQPEAGPVELWEAYSALAEQVANARQLLAGVDSIWLEQAQALSVTAPLEGRALLAWLVRQGRDESLRSQALAWLTESLVASGLTAAAPRLVGGMPLPWAPMNPSLRYRLGEIAAEQTDYRLSVLLWEGVDDVPEALEPRQWLLKRVRVWIRGGRHDAAVELLAGLLSDRRMLPPDLAQEAMKALDELQAAGRTEAVGHLAKLMLPLAEPAQQRQLWLTLGEIAEGQGKPEEAAAHFLLAAAWFAPEALDAVALEARARAARQLHKAGLEEDARRQFDMLQRAPRGGLQQPEPKPDAVKP